MTRVLFSALLCLITVLCFAQSQGEMNEAAAKNYQKADNKLNAVYQQILKAYAEDTVFIKSFKNAQRIWVQLRDAEMKAMYPEREAGYYGSVQPMCWYTYLTQLTNERINKLNTWITGVIEGDVCSGSVKIKE